MKKKNDQLSKDEFERRSCWWMSLSDSERSLRRNALINQLNEATHALVAAGEVSPDEASQLLWLDEDRLYVAPYTNAIHSNVPALKACLEKQEAGPVVAERHKLERLLAACWPEFEMSGAGQLDGEGLLGRTEEPIWEPPYLQFSVEQHGEMVMGSRCVTIQRCQLDLEALTAEVRQEARR